MARRYTYSRTIVTVAGQETFTAQEFDSFDEAQKAVEKGIHDRLLQVKPVGQGIGTTPNRPVPPSTNVPHVTPPGGTTNAPSIPPNATTASNPEDLKKDPA